MPSESGYSSIVLSHRAWCLLQKPLAFSAPTKVDLVGSHAAGGALRAANTIDVAVRTPNLASNELARHGLSARRTCCRMPHTGCRSIDANLILVG